MSDRKLEFRIWQTRLYNLQREAPKPHVVPCTRHLPSRPPQYGIEYHGSITRQSTEKLLEDAPDGAYLIRDSQRAENAYTLVIRFDKVDKNFKLFYDEKNKQHYVGENRFDTIELLVADGLIHFYVETRGADVLQKIAEANNYEQSPFYRMRYHTFNASALGASLDQMLDRSVNLGTGNNRQESQPINVQRRQSPPVIDANKNLVPSSRPALPQTRSSLWRRQSIDAGQLTRRVTASPISSSVAVADGFTTQGQPVVARSDSSRRYREWPPLADRCSLRNIMDRSNSIPAQPPESPPVPPPRITQNSTISSQFYPSNQLLVQSSLAPQADAHTYFETPSADLSLPAPGEPMPVTSPRIPVSSEIMVPTSPIKLPHIPEDIGFATGSSPDTPGLSFAPLASSGSREFDSIGSLTNSSSCSSGHVGGSQMHPSPTHSVPDSAHVNSSLLAGSNIRRFASTGDSSNKSLSPDKGVNKLENNLGTETGGVGSTAMRNLQERYNLPAACFVDQSQSISDSKPHTFKLHTFRGPHWCDYCTHFIWGLVAQGYKCTDCGFQAHKRCADRVPWDCLPDIKQLKRVFGVDLTSLTRAEHKAVPTILVRCIDELERRDAFACEGLYRVPGNRDRIEEARAAFDKDSESADISEAKIPDLNIITSLIKLFLRQLPVPLITYEVYPELIEAVRDENLAENEKQIAIRTILGHLPRAHYESLRYFMGHIRRVAEHRGTNMMSASNLAIVLAPSLMVSSYSDPTSCLAGTRSEHSLVERFIKDFDALFPPLAHPIRRHETTSECNPDPRDRPNSQLITGTPTSPVPPLSRAPAGSKRKFLRNRRSVDAPLMSAAASSPPAVVESNGNKGSNANSFSPVYPVSNSPFTVNTPL